MTTKIPGGGLLSGDLSSIDPVSDNKNNNSNTLNLFKLDSNNTIIKNDYSGTNITMISGGSAKAEGVDPITGKKPSDRTVFANSFTVTKGGSAVTVGTSAAAGADCWFDTTTGILHVTGDGLTISGGGVSGKECAIKIENTVTNVTLDGVNIDAAKVSKNMAGIEIADDSTVTINVTGNNIIQGSGTAAGIQVSDNDATTKTNVTINLQSGSKLGAYGDQSASSAGAGIGAAYDKAASASNITITGSGELTAQGGTSGAGIGAAQGDHGQSIGDITINGDTGMTITATGGQHGAGIGGGWCSNAGNITIIGKGTINASGIEHGTGIGGGCQGYATSITIGTTEADDSELVINAEGGSDGSGIGAGWSNTYGKGDITINSGTITAESGADGAGIGSGSSGSKIGEITINGGVIKATGSTDASGIGSGKQGTVEKVTINGGTITADGGWTNDGGNIGGFSDTNGKNQATVIIDPNNASIKVGTEHKGEGKWGIDATAEGGATDASGNRLYSLRMSYIDELLKRTGPVEGLTVTDNGTAVGLDYSTLNITVKAADGSVIGTWNNWQHGTEDDAYLWLQGQDITLEFEDGDGTKGSVDLKFFETYNDGDYCLWRVNADDLPDEPFERPGYNNPPGGDDDDDEDGDKKAQTGGIILQIGANKGDTLSIPRFYFSAAALGLDTLSIATQDKAQESIDKVKTMINRVSTIRGQYGALQNTLEHISNNLSVSDENLTEAESRIRDTDMAKEMMNYTKQNILIQAVQSMLAQANQVPQGILSLLQ